MAVLINWKICDNAEECSGIEACGTGALAWDAKRKGIVIDQSLCISCGKCEKACIVGAIRVARNAEQLERIKKEFREDPRRIQDLFVDRYGADTVDPTFLIPRGRFGLEAERATKLTAVEVFSEDSIECLLYSIPIKELFRGIDVKYRRTESGKEVTGKYGIRKLPSMLFFREGRFLGKVQGYYPISEMDKLKLRIQKIIF